MLKIDDVPAFPTIGERFEINFKRTEGTFFIYDINLKKSFNSLDYFVRI